MYRIPFLIALLAIVAVAALTSTAQLEPVPGTDSPDCQEARVWHLQAAMRYTEAPDQEYHLGAADAAYLLAEYGAGNCDGWKDDAMPPAIGQDGKLANQKVP